MQVLIRDKDENIFDISENGNLSAIESELVWEEDKYRFIWKENRKYYYLTQELSILQGNILGFNKNPRNYDNMNTIFLFATIINIIFLLIFIFKIITR